MRTTRIRLLVFARAPVPGVAKKRLAPALGAAGAAALHARMVRYTVAKALAAAAQARAGDNSVSLDVELFCSPGTGHPLFQELHAGGELVLRQQHGADLGERMHNALCADVPALLFGCDCPALRVVDLLQAARWLAAGDDAVVGPAADGGYYLIGCRRSTPDLFADIEWGTSSVLQATRTRLAALAWRWQLLPEYPDIDRPDDLIHLPAHLSSELEDPAIASVRAPRPPPPQQERHAESENG